MNSSFFDSRFNTVIPHDSIPLEGFYTSNKQRRIRCSGNTLTQLDPSTLIMISHSGREFRSGLHGDNEGMRVV